MEFIFKIQTKNYGGVAWRNYDKKEYSKEDATNMVEQLREQDETHLYRMAIVRIV